MEYRHYMVRRRCKINGIDGPVNLAYGTLVTAKEGMIMYGGGRVCLAGSENGLRYFSHNDDGMAPLRGKYVQSILDALQKRDDEYQARWDRVWADSTCLKYKNSKHVDYFLWDRSFYEADVEDLKYINNLIGGKFNV